MAFGGQEDHFTVSQKNNTWQDQETHFPEKQGKTLEKLRFLFVQDCF